MIMMPKLRGFLYLVKAHHYHLCYASKTYQFNSISDINTKFPDIGVLQQHAYDGFIWLLERKRKYYRYNDIPMSAAFIQVEDWRKEVARVIWLNEAEIQIIESLLIQSRYFQYTDTTQLTLMTSDQAEQIFMPNDTTGKAFNNWFDMPCE